MENIPTERATLKPRPNAIVLSDIPNNMVSWFKENSMDCIVRFGESGKAFRNQTTQVIPRCPTASDLNSLGVREYESDDPFDPTSRLTDRSYSDLKEDIKIWRINDTKRISDDQALLSHLYSSISDNVQNLFAESPDFPAFTLLPQGDKVTAFMRILHSILTSDDSISKWIRTAEFFSSNVQLCGQATLTAELNRLSLAKDQFRQDFEEVDCPGFVSINKLYSVALMNLIKDPSLTGFRTFLLTSNPDSSLFESPEKLKATLLAWYRSNASLLPQPPSAQGQAYISKVPNHVDAAGVFYAPSPLPKPLPKLSTSLFPPPRTDPLFCPLCFTRCGKKFPHSAAKCKSSSGTRLPHPPSPNPLSQAGRAYLAAYQVDPSSDASINALLALSEHLH